MRHHNPRRLWTESLDRPSRRYPFWLFRDMPGYSCGRVYRPTYPFLHKGYWYFYPWLRVPNDWSAIQDSTQWEDRKVQLPPDTMRASCVVWNDYRQRWILLLEKNSHVPKCSIGYCRAKNRYLVL